MQTLKNNYFHQLYNASGGLELIATFLLLRKMVTLMYVVIVIENTFRIVFNNMKLKNSFFCIIILILPD